MFLGLLLIPAPISQFPLFQRCILTFVLYYSLLFGFLYCKQICGHFTLVSVIKKKKFVLQLQL